MQIFGGYSAIYSNLQEAKQNLTSGNYLSIILPTSNSNNLKQVSMSELEEDGISADAFADLENQVKDMAEGKSKSGIDLSDMSGQEPLFSLYQKLICDLTDGVAASSGLDHNLSHSLGLDQSFSSIDDLVNAISNACLDIYA
jgi:hypothetical protein